MVEVAYVEQGYGLHEYVRAHGYELWQKDGVWLANDPAVQALILTYSPSAVFQLYPEAEG
jgi:hypothetical protein